MKNKKKKSKPSSRGRKRYSPAAIADAYIRAEQFFSQGSLEEAKNLLGKIVSYSHDHADSCHLLGLIALQEKDDITAVSYLKKALSGNQNHPGYLNSLGMAYESQEQYEEAIPLFRMSLRHHPRSPVAANNLGNVLYEVGQCEEAKCFFQRALRIKPTLAGEINDIGIAAQARGDLLGAVKLFTRSIRLNPDLVQGHLNLGMVYMDLGNIDGAMLSLQQAVSLDPKNATARRELIKGRRYSDPKHGDITVCEELLAQQKIPEKDVVQLRYALGKAFDDCGVYDKAFFNYEKANKLKRSRIEYNPQAPVGFVKELIRSFPENYQVSSPIKGLESEQPVFIVGMPRSGTSLVEQIIASHSQAHGAGELENVKKMVAKLSGESFLYRESVDTRLARDFAEEYLIETQSGSDKECLRVADKMPQNFFQLGWISLLFPGARIIHCLRDPLDTCLSVYFQSFTGAHPYSFDLNEIGVYYREYLRLMDHWKKVLPLQLLEVSYEEVVQDVAGQARRMIDFIGLPWEDNCVSYYETKRKVRTASYWQVRQPIYSRSVKRWQNYEAYLEPLLKGLEYSG